VVSLRSGEGEEPEYGNQGHSEDPANEEETPKVRRRVGSDGRGEEDEEEKVREGMPEKSGKVGRNLEPTGSGRENGDKNAKVQKNLHEGPPNHAEKSEVHNEAYAQDGVEETAPEAGEGEPVLLVLAVEKIAHRILHETQSRGSGQDKENTAGIGETGTDPALDEGGAEEHQKSAAGCGKGGAEAQAREEIANQPVVIATPVELAEGGEEVAPEDRINQVGEEAEKPTADGIDRNQWKPGKIAHDQGIDSIPKQVAEAGEHRGSAVAQDGRESRGTLADEEKPALGIGATRKEDEEDLVEKVGEKVSQNEAGKSVSVDQQHKEEAALDDGFGNRGNSDPIVAEMAFEDKGVDLGPKTKARRKAKPQKDPTGFGDPLVSGEDEGNQQDQRKGKEKGGNPDPVEKVGKDDEMVVIALGLACTDGVAEKTIPGQGDPQVEKPHIPDDRQSKNPEAVIVFTKVANHEGSGHEYHRNLDGMFGQTDHRSTEELFGK
jgi:hypothetical protein